MPLSVITGLETKQNWTKDMRLIKLPYNKLTYVGLRDVDEFEKKIIKENNIRQLAVEDILKSMKSMEGPIHISFDVGALDPSYVSSTGTLVSKGLDPNEVGEIFDEALNLNKLVSCDVVEFNGDLGEQESSLDSI